MALREIECISAKVEGQALVNGCVLAACSGVRRADVHVLSEYDLASRVCKGDDFSKRS